MEDCVFAYLFLWVQECAGIKRKLKRLYLISAACSRVMNCTCAQLAPFFLLSYVLKAVFFLPSISHAIWARNASLLPSLCEKLSLNYLGNCMFFFENVSVWHLSIGTY